MLFGRGNTYPFSQDILQLYWTIIQLFNSVACHINESCLQCYLKFKWGNVHSNGACQQNVEVKITHGHVRGDSQYFCM